MSATRKKTQTPQQDGLDFEIYVSSLYESLGYDVKRNIELAGHQIDILVEKIERGAGLVRRVIECKYKGRGEGRVSNSEMVLFIATVKSLLDTERLDGGVLVTNTDFTPKALTAAGKVAYVKPLTAHNLEEELFGLDEAYRIFAKSYERRDIFRNYVPLAGMLQSFDLDEQATLLKDIEDHLITWLHSPGPGFATVLADFGAGKTTLLERIKYRIAKDYLAGSTRRKPLLVLLKEFYRTRTLEGMLVDSMRREFHQILPLELFWNAVNEGGIIFLLDGFDEITAHVDTARRLQSMLSLARVLNSPSKAILSCRTSYFVNSREYKNAVAAIRHNLSPLDMDCQNNQVCRYLHVESPPLDVEELHGRLSRKFVVPNDTVLNDVNPVILELCTFDDEAIKRFLRNHHSDFLSVCKCGWQHVYDFLLKVYDLSDLMKRPILLDMITETILSGVINVNKDSIVFGPAVLYELYTNLQFDRDYGKGRTRQLLKKEVRRSFAEALALTMLSKGQIEVTHADICEIVQLRRTIMPDLLRALKHYAPEAIAADIQVSTLLARHEDGRFKFTHKSFMEFFIARYLHAQMTKGERPQELYQPLPREVVYFLSGFACVDKGFWAQILTLQSVVIDTNQAAVLINNLASVILSTSGNATPFKISSAILTSVTIKSNSLVNSQLVDVHLVNADFGPSATSECRFSNTKFEFSSITSWTDERSRLQVEFIDTTIAGSRWYHSKVVFTGRRAHFVSCSFVGGTLRILGEAVFDECTFIEIDVTIAPVHSGSLVFHNCKFESAKVHGLAERYECAVTLDKCFFDQCSVDALGSSKKLIILKGDTCTFSSCVLLGPRLALHCERSILIKCNSTNISLLVSGKIQESEFRDSSLQHLVPADLELCQCQFSNIVARLSKKCVVNKECRWKGLSLLGVGTCNNQVPTAFRDCNGILILEGVTTSLDEGRPMGSLRDGLFVVRLPGGDFASGWRSVKKTIVEHVTKTQPKLIGPLNRFIALYES